jgi:hypothetical protein
MPGAPRHGRREAGFPRAVELMVRTRAGGGNIDAACCEACGKHLGRYGGEVRRRLAQDQDGPGNLVAGGVENAALLCGSRYDGCRKRAGDRDPVMEAAGWFIRAGNDPRYVPVMRVRPDGTLPRTADGGLVPEWLTGDGRRTTEPPAQAAA